MLFYHALLVTVLVKIQPSRSTSAAAGPIACAPVLRAGNPIAHILQVLVTATLKGNIKQPLDELLWVSAGHELSLDGLGQCGTQEKKN